MPAQEAGAVRAHQLASIRQMMPMMIIANTLNVAAITFYFRECRPPHAEGEAANTGFRALVLDLPPSCPL